MDRERVVLGRSVRKTVRLGGRVLVIMFQLWRGFRPCGPEPGVIMSGAAPEPVAVWISALLAALAAWAAVELLAWLCVKFRDRRCDRNNS